MGGDYSPPPLATLLIAVFSSKELINIVFKFLTTVAPARKRMKYDDGFKPKVVEFAR